MSPGTKIEIPPEFFIFISKIKTSSDKKLLFMRVQQIGMHDAMKAVGEEKLALLTEYTCRKIAEEIKRRELCKQTTSKGFISTCLKRLRGRLVRK